MSTTHLESAVPALISPDAPLDHGTGRRCVKCKGKVSRYTKPLGGPVTGVLLCNPCNNTRIEAGQEVREFAGILPRGYARAYPLPNLKKCRLRRGWTQIDLAREAECGSDHIGQIELGRDRASCKLAGKFARVLGVEIKTLRGAG